MFICSCGGVYLITRHHFVQLTAGVRYVLTVHRMRDTHLRQLVQIAVEHSWHLIQRTIIYKRIVVPCSRLIVTLEFLVVLIT